MFCYNCGCHLSEHDFCTSCGVDVSLYKRIMVLSNLYYNEGLAGGPKRSDRRRHQPAAESEVQ